jgi:hypothetical protein
MSAKYLNWRDGRGGVWQLIDGRSQQATTAVTKLR